MPSQGGMAGRLPCAAVKDMEINRLNGLVRVRGPESGHFTLHIGN